ncbi:hypothetical protein ABW19_dt0210064 [Dactylella cylindrospora]|nr:hypothetical protein ABW19_dt0210064 [Dactylella cylindrospora]
MLRFSEWNRFLPSILLIQASFSLASLPPLQQAAANIETVLAVPAATITAPPRFHPRFLNRRQAGLQSCATYSSVIEGCIESGSEETQFALCACYTSGTYAASYVDGVAFECYEYAVSALGSSDAEPIRSFTDFCKSVGDVSYTLSSLTSVVSSCSSVHSKDRTCAEDPDFISYYGTISAMAACACYAGSSFAGSNNDAWAYTCWSRASLISSTLTSEIQPYTAICASLGDVSASGLALQATCSDFVSLYSSCEDGTTGFFNLPFSRQASCLCYSRGDWIPTVFDDAVGSCVNYASSEFPHRVSSYSPYEELCAEAGDVVADSRPTTTPRTTSVPPRTTTSSTRTSTRPEPGSTTSFSDPTDTIDINRSPSSSTSDTQSSPTSDTPASSTSDTGSEQTSGNGNGSGSGSGSEGGGGGLSGGAIAGVAVGSVAGIGLIAAGAFLLGTRRRMQSPLPPPPTGYGGMGGPEIGGIAEKPPPPPPFPPQQAYMPPPPWMRQGSAFQ